MFSAGTAAVSDRGSSAANLPPFETGKPHLKKLVVINHHLVA
jgi:hypothetical protein